MQSLAHQFLEFCRSKPADEEYDYGSMTHCAMGQYATALGATHGLWRSRNRNPMADGAVIALQDLHSRSLYRVVSAHPRTFGALATRLEAALTEQVS